MYVLRYHLYFFELWGGSKYLYSILLVQDMEKINLRKSISQKHRLSYELNIRDVHSLLVEGTYASAVIWILSMTGKKRSRQIKKSRVDLERNWYI